MIFEKVSRSGFKNSFFRRYSASQERIIARTWEFCSGYRKSQSRLIVSRESTISCVIFQNFVCISKMKHRMQMKLLILYTGAQRESTRKFFSFTGRLTNYPNKSLYNCILKSAMQTAEKWLTQQMNLVAIMFKQGLKLLQNKILYLSKTRWV